MLWRWPGRGVSRDAYTVRLRSRVARWKELAHKATNSSLHLQHPVRSRARSRTESPALVSKDRSLGPSPTLARVRRIRRTILGPCATTEAPASMRAHWQGAPTGADFDQAGCGSFRVSAGCECEKKHGGCSTDSGAASTKLRQLRRNSRLIDRIPRRILASRPSNAPNKWSSTLMPQDTTCNLAQTSFEPTRRTEAEVDESGGNVRRRSAGVFRMSCFCTTCVRRRPHRIYI